MTHRVGGRSSMMGQIRCRPLASLRPGDSFGRQSFYFRELEFLKTFRQKLALLGRHKSLRSREDVSFFRLHVMFDEVSQTFQVGTLLFWSAIVPDGLSNP